MSKSVTEQMATRLEEFIGECNVDTLLDLYRSVFGEDELTNQLRQEIDHGYQSMLDGQS